MKKIVLLFVCIACCLNFCLAQDGSTTFKETEFDFGTIPAKGGKVTHDFEFTNNHSTALVITNVDRTCGCTVPTYTQEPVEPGKTGKITVTFDPTNYSAHFTKTITVHTNHEASIPLTISGTAFREPVVKNPADDYFFSFGNYMLKTKELNFGTVEAGKTKTIKVEVYNKSDKAISHKASAATPKYITTAFAADTVGAKHSSTFEAIFNAATAGYGIFKGDLTLLIDGKTETLPFTATVADVFTTWTVEQKKNAAKINFSETELKFADKEKSKILKISNSGKSDLTIHAVKVAENWVKVSKNKLTVKAGEIVEVKISVDAAKAGDEVFAANIAIFSNDPKSPVSTIKVTGTRK
jgi:hypothetical protein